MTGKELKVLQAKIDGELENINQLKEELQSRGIISKDRQYVLAFLNDDNFNARAVGSILHDFYVAVENIFKYIASEVDESFPADPSWHISLLKQMSTEIKDIRPPVIKRETAQKIHPYRSFRHVFRNVYGFNLDTNRLQTLVADFPEVIRVFTADIEAFQKYLGKII